MCVGEPSATKRGRMSSCSVAAFLLSFVPSHGACSPCPSPSPFLFLRQAKREKEIAELEGKLVTASPEEMEKISAEMAEYERQVASLSKKIEEAAANAAARAGA